MDWHRLVGYPVDRNGLDHLPSLIDQLDRGRLGLWRVGNNHRLVRLVTHNRHRWYLDLTSGVTRVAWYLVGCPLGR